MYSCSLWISALIAGTKDLGLIGGRTTDTQWRRRDNGWEVMAAGQRLFRSPAAFLLPRSCEPGTVHLARSIDHQRVPLLKSLIVILLVSIACLRIYTSRTTGTPYVSMMILTRWSSAPLLYGRDLQQASADYGSESLPSPCHESSDVVELHASEESVQPRCNSVAFVKSEG